MGKIFFFVLAFCLVQNFQTSAQTAEEQASIDNIAQIVDQFGREINEIGHDLSNRVPQIIKNLESSITKVIHDINLTEVFENVKEEIDKLITDESSSAMECTEMASEELENLNEQTKEDIKNCVTLADKSSGQVKDDVKKLMENSNVAAKDMRKKIEVCAEDYPEDGIEMANCIQTAIISINELLKQIKEDINGTFDAAEKITGNIADKIGVCLKELKIDTLRNTEHITDELKSCINEA